MTLPVEGYQLKGISSKAYEHPADRAATASLQAIPYLDRVLRKHGKNIIGKQFATKRLADAMIDLFVLACTMSRVSTELTEKGATAVAKELEILEVLSGQVRPLPG